MVSTLKKHPRISCPTQNQAHTSEALLSSTTVLDLCLDVDANLRAAVVDQRFIFPEG